MEQDRADKTSNNSSDKDGDEPSRTNSDMSPLFSDDTNNLTLGRKKSWFGSLREMGSKVALRAKATVGGLRGDIHPTENENENENEAPTTTTTPTTMRHKRNSSLAASLRGSLRNLHRSTRGKGHGQESPSSKRRGSEEGDIAAEQVPLPSSPINISATAPMLSLDIGSSGFMETALFSRTLSDPANITTGTPLRERKLHVPVEMEARFAQESPARLKSDSSHGSDKRSKIFERSVTPPDGMEKRTLRNMRSIDALTESCAAQQIQEDVSTNDVTETDPLDADTMPTPYETPQSKPHTPERDVFSDATIESPPPDMPKLCRQLAHEPTTPSRGRQIVLPLRPKPNPDELPNMVQNAIEAWKAVDGSTGAIDHLNSGAIQCPNNTEHTKDDPFKDETPDVVTSEAAYSKSTGNVENHPAAARLGSSRVKALDELHQKHQETDLIQQKEEARGAIRSHTGTQADAADAATGHIKEDSKCSFDEWVLLQYDSPDPVICHFTEPADIMSYVNNMEGGDLKDSLLKTLTTEDNAGPTSPKVLRSDGEQPTEEGEGGENDSLDLNEEMSPLTEAIASALYDVMTCKDSPSPDSMRWRSTYTAGLRDANHKFCVDNWHKSSSTSPAANDELRPPPQREVSTSLDSLSADESITSSEAHQIEHVGGATYFSGMSPLELQSMMEPDSTSPMGSRIEFNLQRSERNARYNALHQGDRTNQVSLEDIDANELEHVDIDKAYVSSPVTSPDIEVGRNKPSKVKADAGDEQETPSRATADVLTLTYVHSAAETDLASVSQALAECITALQDEGSISKGDSVEENQSLVAMAIQRKKSREHQAALAAGESKPKDLDVRATTYFTPGLALADCFAHEHGECNEKPKPACREAAGNAQGKGKVGAVSADTLDESLDRFASPPTRNDSGYDGGDEYKLSPPWSTIPKKQKKDKGKVADP